MPNSILDTGSIPFQTEGRLLQELGLRLVASPEVALLELIKNSYDADSPSCEVRLAEDGQTLAVKDTGHGMTIGDFRSKWMRIATSSKIAQQTSPKYRRRLTGAKGIGRFAVRYLGDYLILDSVARDEKLGCTTRLTAEFDWLALDDAQDIQDARVTYQLTRVPDITPTGTVLTVRKLKVSTDFTKESNFRTNLLLIVSPIQGLERGRFANVTSGANNDPGFKVILPSSDNDEERDLNLSAMVLDNYWARLTIELTGRALEFKVWFGAGKKPKTLKVSVGTSISKGFFSDIRFFPRRKGVFQAKGINGRHAWQWVHSNCGVAVVDHGFRVKPYGFRHDDWLQLDIDKAHSERDWRTSLAKQWFPIPPSIKKRPGDNPALNLAYNFQLVGAVFVESRPPSVSQNEPDLTPSMDREGFLKNAAFEELHDYVRAGIEFLSNEDKKELNRIAEIEAREAARSARADIRKAIEFIQRSPTLTTGDKSRIVSQYRRLADRLEEQEEYSEQARRSLMTMGLLGVVAGFMTHESKAVIHELEKSLDDIRALAVKNPELIVRADALARSLENFKGYLDYARLFVKNTKNLRDQPLSAAAQARLVINRFKAFTDGRGIKVINEIAGDVMSPPLPVTVYSGILMNLFTNAIKAVVAVESSIKTPRIVFRGWNEKGKHVIEVADNGVGVPPDLQKRIWEPLYTTTSDEANPLGSGMGLGLTLVRQVATEFDGHVELLEDAPAGFRTCFRVSFPNRKNDQ